MKKIYVILVLCAVNAINTVQGKSTEPSMSASVFEHIILPNIQIAEQSTMTLQRLIDEQRENENSIKRNDAINDAFEALVKSWKAVQAIYILGEVDSDMIDTPRLIDIYHEGNEDVKKQLTRILASGDEPKVALFKNSFKSINALAFLLYADNELTVSERRYIDYILQVMQQRLTEIKHAYQTHENTLLSDNDATMSYLLNALINSAYKLKEWRVGEAAGLSKKYTDNPDNARQEYPVSQKSLLAIMAIITVHDDMLGDKSYPNLGSEAIAQGATAEVAMIRQLITDAKKHADALQQLATIDFSHPTVGMLYKTLSDLNDAYYQSLVKALPVQAKILDADGD